jgi:hypothetical protein
MARKTTLLRAAAIAFLIGAAELSGAIAVNIGLTDSAFAQFRSRGGGGFFDSLFGPRRYGPIEREVPMQAPRARRHRKNQTPRRPCRSW